jgi:hypothetical protein
VVLRFNGLVVPPARDREALEQAVVRGSELLKQGRIEQAQRAFRAALELDPDNARVLALLGLAHFRANEFAEARVLYEQLVARAPTDASHRLNLGLVYLKLNDAEHAVEALEASRALDPSQGRAVSYLGLAYARGGRYAEAYRAFLIAGQNDLATEIESNLATIERDRIHAQLGRTPQGPLPSADGSYVGFAAARISQQLAVPAGLGAPTPRTIPRVSTSPGVPRTPTPQSIPRTPTPTGIPRTASGELPHIEASALPGTRTPTPQSVPRTASGELPRIEASALPRTRTPTPQNTPRTPTPTGIPRTKPPSAPPGKSRTTQELPAVSPPDPLPAATDEPAGTIHVDAIPATTPPSETPYVLASRDAGRISDSTQFVMPRGEPAAPIQTLDGPSMISRAVASATPTPTIGMRAKAGGVPPRPLSELATDDLLRPDESDDVFEISASGALIVRVSERMMSRLEGVYITGGDLAYEPAMRRSRGHNTEHPFDYGGSQLHAVSGRGYLIAVPGKHVFSAVMLDDDILYLREDLVFAFEGQLRWENGNVPGLRGKLPVVQFRGDGALAMRLTRPLVRVKLPAQGMVFVDAERLAGWVGRVIPRAVVPPAGGPLGAMCVECTGEGIVLVEPAANEPLAAAMPAEAAAAAVPAISSAAMPSAAMPSAAMPSAAMPSAPVDEPAAPAAMPIAVEGMPTGGTAEHLDDL